MEHNLTPKQVTAAQLLAAGNSWKEVQGLTKTAPASISKWLKDKEFKSYIRHLQTESFHSSFGLINELLPKITKRLSLIATGEVGETPASVQVQAIKLLFDTYLKYKETDEFEDRLLSLEAKEMEDLPGCE